MAEFSIQDKTYRTNGKLDALKQFHIARRVAPVLSVVAPVLRIIKQEPLAALGPISEALGKMSDADSEYVLYTCLGVVQRQQGPTLPWANISTGNGLQFDDIDLLVMIQITYRVLEENLSGFFSALPSSLKDELAGALVQQ